MSVATGIEPGQQAPDICLPDQHGLLWRLQDARGRPVVILFYPADETPVCTRQLCSVRDHWQQYQQAGAEVVGINTDTVEKHQRFAERHELPLRLLSDSDGRVVRAYGMKNLFGTKRGVIVIDGQGIIRWRKVVLPVFRPEDDEIIQVLRSLS